MKPSLARLFEHANDMLACHQHDRRKDGRRYLANRRQVKAIVNRIGVGCGAYDARPQSCKDFACLWLQGIGSDNMKPDKSKVVMASTILIAGAIAGWRW